MSPQFWPGVAKSPITQAGSAYTSASSGVAGSSAWTTYGVTFQSAFPGVPQIFEVIVSTGDIAAVQVMQVTASGASFRVHQVESTGTPVGFSGWRATYLP